MARFRLKLADVCNGHYVAGNHNPQTMNIRTGRIAKKNTHHCPECEGPATLACYQKLHLTYYRTWVKVGTDNEGNDVYKICGERYACESPKGCATHTYPDHNQYLKAISKGEDGHSLEDDSVEPQPAQPAPQVEPDVTEEEKTLRWYIEQGAQKVM